MTTRVAFNPTESPVVVDDDGRVLPGLERGEVDDSSEMIQQAVAGGQIVWPEEAEAKQAKSKQAKSKTDEEN